MYNLVDKWRRLILATLYISLLLKHFFVRALHYC